MNFWNSSCPYKPKILQICLPFVHEIEFWHKNSKMSKEATWKKNYISCIILEHKIETEQWSFLTTAARKKEVPICLKLILKSNFMSIFISIFLRFSSPSIAYPQISMQIHSGRNWSTKKKGNFQKRIRNKMNV